MISPTKEIGFQFITVVTLDGLMPPTWWTPRDLDVANIMVTADTIVLIYVTFTTV